MTLPMFERTEEERRIGEMDRLSPIHEIPADTIRGADAAQLLKFAATVRRERESTGMTVEQLAERAGTEASSLSRFETGQCLNVTVFTLFRIAHALGRRLVMEFEALLAAEGE